MTLIPHTYDKSALVITPAKTESLQYVMKQTAGCIDLCANANKTEFVCFEKDTSSHISPTESDVILFQGNNRL